MKITVTPYCPEWKTQFENIQRELEALLEGTALAIEHIGSTAVEGLAAKPIIDVAVGVRSETDFDAVVRRMARRSDCIYYQAFNEGMPGRRLFVQLKAPAASYGLPQVFEHNDTIPHEAVNEHRLAHIHVWVYGTPDWIRHIAVRDYLRAHEAERNAYAELKLRLSRQEWEHGMAYNDGKNDFVKALEKRALDSLQ